MIKKILDTSNLKGDLFGGITAGIVALPLALAFGVQSGMGAIAGLYGAIVLGFFASLLGGTNTQISGPTGPMTVVSSVVVLEAVNTYGDINSGIGFIVLIFLLAGALQIVMGVLKLGVYIKYIPYPVVSGFMTGIGVIIILLQIFPFFGQESPKKVLEVVLQVGKLMSGINVEAVFLASATIAVIYLFPRVTKAIPSTLVALIALTIASGMFGLKVPVIGDIPGGFPSLQLGHIFNLDLLSVDYYLVVELALTLAVLGGIDSLLTSVIADNLTKTKHDSNRELIGQGIGNMMGASIAGLPGAGATMRTLVNVNSGGQTKISGMIHGLLLLFILLGLGVYASQIPLPVLAGILITVGVGIIDYKGLRHIKHIPKADAVVMIMVLVLTVFVDLIQAVAAGLVLSSVLFMKQMSDEVGREVKILPLKDYMDDLPWDEERIPASIMNQIYVKHLDGPLFFGFASSFQEIAKTLEDVSVVIFRMKLVPHVDQTGLYALEEVILDLEKRGIAVVITGLKPQPLRMLRRINLIPGLIPENYHFKNFHECIDWLDKEFKAAGKGKELFFEELGKTGLKDLKPNYRL